MFVFVEGVCARHEYPVFIGPFFDRKFFLSDRSFFLSDRKIFVKKKEIPMFCKVKYDIFSVISILASLRGYNLSK